MASIDGMTREQLIALVKDMEHDWAAMNRFINTQATAFGWCDEYEERLYKYNSEFKTFQAVGRVPEGKQIMHRNAYAARRLTMGHIMSVLEKAGIPLPTTAFGGVVRDHLVLEAAKDELVKRITETRSK